MEWRVVMKEVMSIKETAVYLGLSESKIRRMVKSGTIPVAKLGGQYRFYLPRVQEWLSAITTVSATPVEQRAVQIANQIWNNTAGDS